MLHFKFANRFVVQLILVFILFTLGSVIVLGIPVTWMLNRQADVQLRALIDQTQQTTLALLENRKNQNQDLAILITERPTLNQLLSDNAAPEVINIYFENFIENAEIDAITLCSQSDVLVSTGIETDSALCDPGGNPTFLLAGEEVWLFAAAPLNLGEQSEWQVVVGERAFDLFLEFNQQSGLQYFLFEGDKLLVTSDEAIDPLVAQQQLANIDAYEMIELAGERQGTETSMAGVIPLENAPFLKWVGLLNIEPYTSLNRQLRNVILATLAAVGLIGAGVAVLVSQRISRPLNQLAQSAAALRKGDLATPLLTASRIWEIDQLTNALEDARVSLKHSLDQLRMDKAWIESLLNAIIEGLLTIDEKSRITFASETVERILGVSESILLGRPIDDFFITNPTEDLFSHQMPEPGQSSRISILLDGKEVLLAVSASTVVPLEAGNATRALVIRDVTNEERIHRLLGEFLANITHEFRTPLAALSASTELLLDQLPTLSTPEVEELLQALNIGIIDLQSLIDNLIEAASIEAGRFKVNPQPVELDVILTDAVNTVLPIVTKHRLNLVQPQNKPTYEVIADRRRTVQALINLLSNAIKHSPQGGTITLTTLILDVAVLVEVRDEGQGISPERRTQLFKRFIKPTEENDATQLSLGLGLSVVKAIVEAQNGKVGFRDTKSGGALFWFTLPIATGEVE